MTVSVRTTAPDKRMVQTHEHLTNPVPPARERTLHGNGVGFRFGPECGDFRSAGGLDAYTMREISGLNSCTQ